MGESIERVHINREGITFTEGNESVIYLPDSPVSWITQDGSMVASVFDPQLDRLTQTLIVREQDLHGRI